jgi:hypothetical protein
VTVRETAEFLVSAFIGLLLRHVMPYIAVPGVYAELDFGPDRRGSAVPASPGRGRVAPGR